MGVGRVWLGMKPTAFALGLAGKTALSVFFSLLLSSGCEGQQKA